MNTCCLSFHRPCTISSHATQSPIPVHPCSFSSSHRHPAQLRVEISKGGRTPLTVFTSHLESLADRAHAAERTAQAALVLRRFPSCAGAAVFAGDLNMRDAEQAALPLGAPASRGAFDAWQRLGSAAANRFTWDLARNSNLHRSMPQNARPRCRFDRIYCSDSPKHGAQIAPISYVRRGQCRECD